MTVFRRVAKTAHVEPSAQHVLPIESDIDRRQNTETSHEESGHDEKQQAKGHLQDDECTASEKATTALESRAPLERVRHVIASRADGRQQSARHSRDQRHRQRIADDTPIESSIQRHDRARTARKERDDQVACPRGDDKAERATAEAKQQTLHDQLPRETEPAGTE